MLRQNRDTEVAPTLQQQADRLKVGVIARSQLLAEGACDPWPRHTFSWRTRIWRDMEIPPTLSGTGVPRSPRRGAVTGTPIA